ncbi:MAG: HAMP domain-containing sensor histidine kinase [Thermodesulfobacteriota bacterium]
MQIYRPKSFLFLVIAGFILVTIPLLAAILSSEMFLRRMTGESAATIYRAVVGTEHTAKIEKQLLGMERKARQYAVLGEENLLSEIAALHSGLGETIATLTTLRLPDALKARLASLQEEEEKIYERILESSGKSKPLKQAITDLAALNAEANVIHTEGTTHFFQRIGELQDAVARARQTLIFQAVGLIVVSIVLVAIFAYFLTRPIKLIDQAIHRLGLGDFQTPVSISGSQDMVFLGQRLDWLRRELADFDKEKKKFISHVSHELKTPLASIREGAELLAEEEVGPLNQHQAEIAEILRKNSVLLHKLIDNLLGYNMAQAKTTVLHLSEVPVDDLVREVVGDHRPASLKKQLDIDLGLDQVSARADRRLLKTVIDNLFSNALKHTPSGGVIRMHLYRQGGSLVFDIVDSGPGINGEDAKRIFEPFFQGQAPSTSPVKGTGIGLAIAREYIAAHDGRLDLVPDNDGGAHFRFSIPISGPAMKQGAAASA